MQDIAMQLNLQNMHGTKTKQQNSNKNMKN